MPRPRLPHLHRQTTRHGKTVWYVRVDKGRRVRLRAAHGTPEFQTEYLLAIDGKLTTGRPTAAPGTLAWLFERYRETSAWKELSPATKRQRENIFSHVLASAGKESYTKITKSAVTAGRDRRSDTPHQARNFLDAMRGLFRWAHETGKIKTDPTAGVSNPGRPKSGGFPAWTEADVQAFESRWPVGTRQRVWLMILLYTGMRRGDAVRLGPEHVQDGIATLQTEKTGQTVTIPILPVLAAALEAGPVGESTFVCGARGQALSKETFGNEFSLACRAAGFDKSAHGVRKIGATRAAENGATVAELEAIFGWSGGGMASLYTRTADRARLSKAAIQKLAPIPPPTQKGEGTRAKT